MIDLDDLVSSHGTLKALADENLILEFFLERNDFLGDAEKTLKLFNSPALKLYVTSLCLSSVEIFTEGNMAEGLETLLKRRIIQINDSHFTHIQSSSNKNIRSALELSCAISHRMDVLVTNDPPKYGKVDFPICTVNDLSSPEYRKNLKSHSRQLLKNEINILQDLLSIELSSSDNSRKFQFDRYEMLEKNSFQDLGGLIQTKNELNKISLKILNMREKRGLSQAELAQKIGVLETTIASWENSGHDLHSMVETSRLCKALDCGLDDLVTNNGEKDSPANQSLDELINLFNEGKEN